MKILTRLAISIGFNLNTDEFLKSIIELSFLVIHLADSQYTPQPA
ncbi:hypothetical protein JCM19238_5063 [Vibrio ponticus]|nr:hypothetical protein JCM19238_5063 [Vibrio ponticus]